MHQQSTHRSSFAGLVDEIRGTTCQCSASATARSTHAAASSIVDEFAVTAYWARSWRSARFCSVMSRIGADRASA